MQVAHECSQRPSSSTPARRPTTPPGDTSVRRGGDQESPGQATQATGHDAAQAAQPRLPAPSMTPIAMQPEPVATQDDAKVSQGAAPPLNAPANGEPPSAPACAAPSTSPTLAMQSYGKKHGSQRTSPPQSSKKKRSTARSPALKQSGAATAADMSPNLSGIAGRGNRAARRRQPALSGSHAAVSQARQDGGARCGIGAGHRAVAAGGLLQGGSRGAHVAPTFMVRGARSAGWEGEQWASHGSLKRRCLLYTSPSPRDRQKSRMPSSA